MYLIELFSIASPLIPILNCVFIFLFKKWLGPVGTFTNSIIFLFSFLFFLLIQIYSVLYSGSYLFCDLGRWFFCLNWFDSHLIICFDLLALVSAFLVASLTILALYFGVEYMYREAFLNRLLYLLNLFATSVILLFFCYDLFLILIMWECIGLFSLLLVNFYSNRIYTIKASMKTFIFSRLSDFFMFFFFILSILIFKTTDLSLILIQVPFLIFHGFFFSNIFFHFLTVYSFCLALSGVIKSAQFFFHVWLPDAMEAPTPASALIHSSTLVVAGIFLIMRFGTLFEFTPLTNYFLACLGSFTLAFASVTATFQNDIKKLVAYSTISQIGYLVCGCGFLCYEETFVYLCIHAVNKAFLFILVGYMVHFFNANTDLRQMGAAYLFSFDIAVLLFGVSINLFGLPYSAGFIGKEFLIFQFFNFDSISIFVRICWLISFIFTPIYMWLLIFLVQYGPKKGLKQSYLFDSNFNFTQLMTGATVSSRLLISKIQTAFMTSQSTVWLLFSFWLLFYWTGETFLLLIFDINSPFSFFQNANFLWVKTYSFAELTTFSSKTLLSLNFSIVFFIISVVNWFVSLRLESIYNNQSPIFLYNAFLIFFFVCSVLI